MIFCSSRVDVVAKNWILVYTERDAGKARDFTKTLVEVGSKMGMKIGALKMVGLPNDRTVAVIKIYTTAWGMWPLQNCTAAEYRLSGF